MGEVFEEISAYTRICMDHLEVFFSGSFNGDFGYLFKAGACCCVFVLVLHREFVRGHSLVCESKSITIVMPLEHYGIRFESLPETWTSSTIYPSLTYEQCVELEE